MNSEPRDCASLDPTLDPLRWQAFTGRVRAAIEPELARRSVRNERTRLLFQWTRPVLSGAVAVAVIAIGSLMVAPSRSSGSSTEGGTELIQAMGLPAPLASWVETGVTPTAEEIIAVLPER